MKLEDFLDKYATRELHNEGFKLPIDDEQHLIIYGVDSDVAREVAVDRYRINPEDGPISDQVRRLYSRLVKSWSFDEPITVDLVEELFKAYPHIYDLVMDNYSKRKNFTKGQSKS